MLKHQWIIALIALSIVLSTACSQITSGPAGAPATDGVAQPGWQDDWEKTLAAAKKEGTLVMYTGASPELRAALGDTFKNKFGINIEWVAGAGPEIAKKIISERTAGMNLGDLNLIGPITALTTVKPAGVLAPIKPLLVLPEVLDPKAYDDGEVPLIDKEGIYVLGHGTYVMLSLAINTDMVKPGEIEGFGDLLSPKWKGKIILNDPTMPGPGSTFFFMTAGYVMNLDYHKQLAKQEIVITRDWRQQVEWVAKGKYPISLAGVEDVVASFQKAGAPIKWISPKEGAWLAIGASGSLSYLDKAPHPNAAKVFANWLLTKEGMTLWSQYTLLPGARKDVSKDHLQPEKLRVPGVKYFNPNKEEMRLKEREFEQVAKEIYASLLQ